MEVNHISPLQGRKRSNTCENHLDNLELLCHQCHKAATDEQRRLGLLTGVHLMESPFFGGYVK